MVMGSGQVPVSKGHMKGVVYREFTVWFEARFGREEALRIYHALPREVARSLVADPQREAWGILSSRWYEAADVHVLLEEMLRGRSDSERATLVTEGTQAVVGKM